MKHNPTPKTGLAVDGLIPALPADLSPRRIRKAHTLNGLPEPALSLRSILNLTAPLIIVADHFLLGLRFLCVYIVCHSVTSAASIAPAGRTHKRGPSGPALAFAADYANFCAEHPHVTFRPSGTSVWISCDDIELHSQLIRKHPEQAALLLKGEPK